jgi:rhodanese-related sulfurtransferase
VKRKHSRALRAGAILTALALLLAVGHCGSSKLRGRPLEWKSVLEAIRKDYPAVPQLSAAAFAASAEQAGNREGDVLLIDAREPEEFAVSRIAGARNLRTVEDVKAAKIPADARLVLYCSVGYRSSALAEKLMAAGFSNVANLEGSIFAWVNEGRPVVGPDGEATTRVHPFSDRWGALLDVSKVTKVPKENE